MTPPLRMIRRMLEWLGLRKPKPKPEPKSLSDCIREWGEDDYDWDGANFVEERGDV